MLSRETREWAALLWQEYPELKRVLEDSAELEQARTKVQALVRAMETAAREWPPEVERNIDYGLALEAAGKMQNICTRRAEQLCGFSTLEILWRMAKGEIEGISWGFPAEMLHMFRAISGTADYSKGWLETEPAGRRGKSNPGTVESFHGVDGSVSELGDPTGSSALEFRGVAGGSASQLKAPAGRQLAGREAAKARSAFLDDMSRQMNERISRYRCGMEAEIESERQKNIEQILNYFGGTRTDWEDWRWHLRHVLRGPEGVQHLSQLVPLDKETLESCRLAAENRVAFGITPYYLSLFDFTTSDRLTDRGVRTTVLPPKRYVEMMIAHREDREYRFDFMREHDTSPIKLITRRYPSVAILKPYNSCPQICVYCQRNWEITGPLEPHAKAKPDVLARALDWIERHHGLRDILITGGDPLVLGDDQLGPILDRLRDMDHVELIRIGTRTPVTLPARFTPALVAKLSSLIVPGRRSVCVVTHFETVREVTPESARAVAKLRAAGIPVYNQHVYTAYVSRRFENAALRIALKKIGVDPYYSFYPKGKEEHRGYTIPVARMVQERVEEARLLPGQFRTDESVFNVPGLGKSYISAYQDRELLGIRPEGNRVYLWYPWEKGVTRASTYVHVDTPISEYFETLEEMQEDLTEYESLWYYY